jgi:hypothetical protein
MLVQANTGKIPLISLVWIPTGVSSGKVSKNAAIEEFKVVITQEQIDEIFERVKKARKEIDEAYKSWFKMKNY